MNLGVRSEFVVLLVAAEGLGDQVAVELVVLEVVVVDDGVVVVLEELELELLASAAASIVANSSAVRPLALCFSRFARHLVTACRAPM